ncbi:hypothetical protein A4E84_35655 [Streptomyces qaidamensis]|uniref:DUF6777 domain-containing protein n=1 Tax=Streptomyces qaidamensis TaxID=1783515 RepID=A0A143CA85_9ACTN|nr:DUF6777 domain-containing protein [Streptomyces qaidamensis]AMW14363.1 hypothetical protein A4E84_35655 [Streptomyces qaidamensis]
MRTSTGASFLACVLSAALLSGCGGATGRGGSTGLGDDAGAGGELLLQPAADPGPDPFTDSTALTAATPSPAPRTPAGTDRASTASGGPRSLSGKTPGLYGGTERTGSCDIGRQVGRLTRDPVRGRAFAGAAGISPASLPDHVRALTPVVLRADTRVTGHGFRAGRITRHQSVLQAGTAVLVDDRGLPRLRCACGNPLRPPVAPRGTPVTTGTPWPGYRPGEAIVVPPAPRAVTGFTIIDSATRAWIERRTGHDVRHDRALPPPSWATHPPQPPRTPDPDPGPGTRSASPRDVPADASLPDTNTNTNTNTGPLTDTGSTDTDIDTPVPPAVETTPPPGRPAEPEDSGEPDEAGPDAVPDNPDPPDGAGLIPDDRAARRIPDSSTNVFTD